MVSFTHVIKSPLFSDVLSRQTHIHHTGRFYFFQISCSIGMLKMYLNVLVVLFAIVII